jgi:hypothetical protein
MKRPATEISRPMTPPPTHASNAFTMFAYNLEDRTHALRSVKEIANVHMRRTALEGFIEDELTILNGMTPPKVSSAALKSARTALHALNNPVYMNPVPPIQFGMDTAPAIGGTAVTPG